MKGVTATKALSLTHAIQWIGEAGKHGVSYGNTSWQLGEELVEYLVDLAE